MTRENWLELVKRSCDDEALAANLALALHEADIAKNLLRKAGFGWIGLGLIETVQETIRWVEDGEHRA